MPVVVLLCSFVVGAVGSAYAQAVAAATILQPSNGASGVDQTAPITWTGVANARAYYLYVGTAPGARDPVDSGELRQTSYSVSISQLPLPAGSPLYVTLWTEVDGSGSAETRPSSPV